MKPLHDLTPIGRGRRLRPIAKQLLAEYGLESAQLRQLTDASNTIFHVSDPGAGDYALRITAPKSCHGAEETRSEVAWLSALAQEPKIGCAVPVARHDGGYVTTLDVPGAQTPLPACLFRWVPGVMLADVLSPENVSRQGQLMARMHAFAAGFHPPDEFRIRTYDSVFPYAALGFAGCEPVVLFERGEGAALTPAQRSIFQTAHQIAEEEIAAVMAGNDALRVIHNDLHMWNVKAHGETLYALDFEDMMWGHPIQDIATTMYYYRWRDDYEAFLAAFRSGYEAVLPWPESRPERLEILIVGRMLLLANYISVSLDSEDRAFAPEYLKRIEGRLRAFLQHHAD